MSIRVRALEQRDRETWDDYVRRAPGSHFGQLCAWKALVEEHYGCRSRYWLAEREGFAVGILPLFERRVAGRVRSLFSAPGGLLADDAEVADALLAPAREQVRAQHLDYAELRDQRRRWEGLATSEEHCTLVLPLAADVEAQWKAFPFKLRNKLRKAGKAGFAVRWGSEHLAEFHRVMLENMRDLGTPIAGPAYYRRMLEHYGGAAEIEVIALADRPVGALCVVTHAGGMANPWSSSLRAYRALCPNHALYWEAIQRAIGRGLRRFDFGRSQWHSNTFEFKHGWGAKPVPLYYQYVLGQASRIPSLEDQKRSLDLAIRVWRRLPLPVAKILGGAARRRFPEAL